MEASYWLQSASSQELPSHHARWSVRGCGPSPSAHTAGRWDEITSLIFNIFKSASQYLYKDENMTYTYSYDYNLVNFFQFLCFFKPTIARGIICFTISAASCVLRLSVSSFFLIFLFSFFSLSSSFSSVTSSPLRSVSPSFFFSSSPSFCCFLRLSRWKHQFSC